jgi:hypothetical protein
VHFLHDMQEKSTHTELSCLSSCSNLRTVGLIFIKYCEFYVVEDNLKIVIFSFCAIGKSCMADRQICDARG